MSFERLEEFQRNFQGRRYLKNIKMKILKVTKKYKIYI